MAASESQRTTGFGFWAAHFVVISCMVGAGILTTSGFTLNATGNPQALLVLWLIGGVMALAGALTVSELATMLPRAGGDYIYVREAFGTGAGFVSGFATFILGFAAPTAVVASTAVNYLLPWFLQDANLSADNWWYAHRVQLGASIFIAVLTFSHCLGHRQSTWIQVVSTLTKVLILVGLAFAGLLSGKGNWSHFSQGGFPDSSQWPALGTGLIYIGYAYSGWNGASYLAGEIQKPARNLPFAMLTGCGVVIVLYLLLNVMFIYLLDPHEMRTAPMQQVARVAEFAAGKAMGAKLASLLSMLLGLSLVASVSAYLLAGPRVAYAMAKDGLFFSAVGRLSNLNHVPVAATMLQGVLAITFLWAGTFLQLLDYTAVGLAVLSALTVSCVFRLRKGSQAATVYRMPMYPLPPLFFIALIGWTVTQALMQPEKRIPTLLALGTILIGYGAGKVYGMYRS